ncbi:amino acid ABC transporter permease [Haloarcula nitratireducens]|uniref:Amino acid ABC transporter permease n=1 Tax=Haloarcula nitratireducens TaxID=2487749 RepID=A0AAW4PA23_9EURY|nr:amino acid ABC transporter permease [Halomicroarcula nitratireducens]MBX0294812.1 amino acid ABC transporter permease [Halomicroarcula nitratireducens]
MSTGEPSVADEVRTTVTVDTDRPWALAGLAVFWGWLLIRWTNDFLLPNSLAFPSDRSFVPVAPFASAAESVGAVAASLGLFGAPLDVLAGVLSFFAGAIPSLPPLARGAWLTIVLTVAGIAFGFVLAVPLSVARVYGGRGLRWLSLSYTELLRGTPLLAQLFVLYFGLPLTQIIRTLPGVGVGMVPGTAVWVAIIGFTLNSAAYQAEYIRSALESVDAGQLTAARSIGLSKVDGIRYVVLPQGLRYAIPGWSNELVYLIKYSSLAAFITVRELFFQAESIANDTFRYTELFVLAALFYLALVVSASLLMNVVEERTAIPGLGGKRRA